ncbi:MULTISPECIES: hypothetical protein [Vagococcus]|uniref:DUF2187 domain-containing protein n=1 Tax=Vagococcus fluvialis bH819 TaxID=1255619 RepID=A0A1X6WNU9_9ENTE|nr:MULTISPECIES: hypothetical protein [Vagococcus]SLM85950.1 hypothetical protein FM121_07595 [Vagococcus fluvialis bH819]HCM88317.1 hypothetical protein [Vagococcus sp.]
MAYNNKPYSLNIEIKENNYNIMYDTNETISFSYPNDPRIFTGTILKKYTHSCLIDITSNPDLSYYEKQTYKGKIVISYKSIL